MKLNEEFPDLEQFFGGYFHQDWKDFYGSAETAIEQFVNDASRAELAKALRELDDLLALGLPEAELDEAMCEDIGCYYNPRPSGKTMSEWLQWVRSMLIKYGESAPA